MTQKIGRNLEKYLASREKQIIKPDMVIVNKIPNVTKPTYTISCPHCGRFFEVEVPR